jgi:hypothetical protein
MNHQFLRAEAARFRGMADDTDREASKDRLLAMAADYESRARIAGTSTTSDLAGAIIEPSGADGAEMLTQPDQDEAIKPLSGRKVDGERNSGASAERRSVGRSKLRLTSESTDGVSGY